MKTVKTEEKAIKILESWLCSHTEELLKMDTFITHSSANCECGETLAYQAYFDNSDLLATVAVCDACGDDDLDENEVLNII